VGFYRKDSYTIYEYENIWLGYFIDWAETILLALTGQRVEKILELVKKQQMHTNAE